MKKLHWSLLKRLYRLRGRFGIYGRLGRQWLLDNRNWVDQQLIIRRPYEAAQIDRCRELINAHRLESFFDIGANFGLYSVLLSDEARLSQIHAFEPLPRNVHQLGANLYLNNLDQRVKLYNMALGDRNGKLDLHVDPFSTGVSSVVPDQLPHRQDSYQSAVEVEARIFDELFSASGTRALMKIDVEGAELLVLAGMRKYLRDNHVALQVETIDQTREQVDGFMQGAGYRCLGRVGADAYYTNI